MHKIIIMGTKKEGIWDSRKSFKQGTTHTTYKKALHSWDLQAELGLELGHGH